jgi:hypothetical protein
MPPVITAFCQANAAPIGLSGMRVFYARCVDDTVCHVF